MAVRFAARGWQKWLELYVRQAREAHLYTGDGSSPAALTEVGGGDYLPHALIGARWEFQARGPLMTATYPDIIWTFTGPIPTPVEGYYVTDKDGDVVWWEPFAEPFQARRASQMLGVSMVIEQDTEN